MRKDGLVFLLLLTGFALLGADCRAPWEDDDVKQRPLPDRATAASPLLRAYYDMRTFPEEMRELKIPEGNTFDDDFLSVEFEMGGAETVTEVRTHLYLMPPKSAEFDACELICRCEAPNGTKSDWKAVDVQFDDVFSPQAEIAFMFEFDGLTSDGTWKIHLRDYSADGDGRCLFRNGSLHINRGEDSTPGAGANQTVTLDAATGNYGLIPEAQGKREPLDIGWFGTDRMFANNFTFTTPFFVQSISFTASFYIHTDTEFEARTNWVLVGPSGNWLAGAFPEVPLGTLDLSSTLTLSTFTVSLGSVPAGLLMNLNGEASAGTWTLYIVDTLKDNNTSTLTTDGINPVPAPALQADFGQLSMTLSGIG